LPAAILFLVLAIIYWRIDVTGAARGKLTAFIPAAADLYSLYYPIIRYGIGSMKGFHIPLWNPYQALGVPFLGSALFGLFSPFSFLYYILPTHLAMGYSTILNIALAGLFTFIFLRKSLKIQTAGAVTGALVFMFSGPLLLEVTHPSLLGAMSFLPLILFLTHKVFETGSGRWTVFFTLALACQMLTGAVQIIVHTIFMTGAYALTLFWMDRKYGKTRLRPIFLLSIGGTMAIALSSLQWFPLMELSGFTGRDHTGLSLKDVEPLRSFMNPWFINKAVFLGEKLFNKGSLYIGVLPAILGLAAVFKRKKKSSTITMFFVFVAIVTFLLALGTYTPIYKIYYHYIPTGKIFRMPMRWLWLTAFATAVLSAMGSEAIFKALEGRSAQYRGAVIIIPLIVTAFLFHYNVVELFNHPQKTPGIFKTYAKEGAFLRRVQGEARTYIASDFLHDYSLLQKFGTLEKVFVLNDTNTLSLDSYRRFVGVIQGNKKILRDNTFDGIYKLRGRPRDLRLMNLQSVRFIMEHGKKAFPNGMPWGIHKIYENKGIVIYKNDGALPRAYVVYNSETISDNKKALERLASPFFNLRSTVILDRDAGLDRRHDSRLKRAWITRLAPEKIEMVADLDQKGVLVLTDFYYPGWKAFVDGVQRPVLRANAVMRGLVLEKGSHRVVFIYRPRPFLIGLWTSILTLAGLVIYLGVDMKMRRSAKKP